MEWKDFIQPELLTLMPFLYGAGVLIKNTPKIKNWLIPYILLGISVVVTIIYFVLQTGKNFNGVTFAMALGQAALLAMSTVGGNEFIKQITVGRIEDCNKKCKDTPYQTKKEEPGPTDNQYIDNNIQDAGNTEVQENDKNNPNGN